MLIIDWSFSYYTIFNTSALVIVIKIITYFIITSLQLLLNLLSFNYIYISLFQLILLKLLTLLIVCTKQTSNIYIQIIQNILLKINILKLLNCRDIIKSSCNKLISRSNCNKISIDKKRSREEKSTKKKC